MKLERIYLNETGIAMFVGGQTSTAIMRILWHKPATSKYIWQSLRNGDPYYRDAAYTTIATTCQRLTDRGFLKRENIGTDGKPLYLYTPILNEKELLLDCLTQLFDVLYVSFPDVLQEIME